MDPHLTRLEVFIAEERRRYPGDNNNLFAFALAQATRYERFVRIILHRHREISTEWYRRHTDVERMRGQSGVRALTMDEMAEMEQRIRLTTALHLEVESFYLFAKIFLDNAARFIEHNFGPERGLSLDSHDDLAKNFTRYAAAKGLSVPAELADELRDLKARVADFRDYQIAHAKSPRALRATVWGSDNEPRMAITHLYPRGDELGREQQESESLDGLMRGIDQYIGRLMTLIVENRPKSRYLQEGTAERTTQ